ncbi:MAG: DUF805 domain-containing protein [Candidatus Eremiobacteraeota bacterium]|nr:DUF805 domain-containing protein [Candidatus Eremiobacteraeota bacterium]
MSWYMAALKKYAIFSGRARRAEYWYFTLFNALLSWILYGVSLAVLRARGVDEVSVVENAYGITVLLCLPLVLPSIAVSVRRLHDTGKSGWWLLLTFVPFISLTLLIFYCLNSEPGENIYGPNPKGVGVAQRSVDSNASVSEYSGLRQPSV